MDEIVPPKVIGDLTSLALKQRKLDAYDREIGIELIHEDEARGIEHYLVRYPAGLSAKWHWHRSPHTIFVIEGAMHVNDEVIGPGSYCH